MVKGNRRKLRGGDARRRWEALPWRAVDTSGVDMGDFADSVFFGLEEIDGEELSALTVKGGAISSSDDTASLVNDSGKPQELNPIKIASKSNVKDNASSEKHSKKRKRVDLSETPTTSPNESAPTAKDHKMKTVAEKTTQSTSLPKDVHSTTAHERKTTIHDRTASWGGLELHQALVASMESLNFQVPTRIQSLSVPAVLRGACDVVASSETGSGKTLAFGIPIIHSLLSEWSLRAGFRSPYALILAPTRELAMQISSVLTDVCKAFRESDRRIEVVNIVGGMSEHKQRRQLDDTKGRGRQAHIMVATPGRLCELMTNSEEVAAFSDLSDVRYLVVDEADRMVEDGHFPELSRIFSRIRDHETLAQRGVDPVEAAVAARRGVDEDGFAGEGVGSKEDDVPNPFYNEHGEEIVHEDEDEAEASMKIAFRSDGLVSYDDVMRAMRGESSSGSSGKGNKGTRSSERTEATSKPVKPKKRLDRQTLLFSATILTAVGEKNKQALASSALARAAASGEAMTPSKAIELLPSFLKQLMKSVAVQKNVRLVDSRVIVADAAAASSNKGAASGKEKEDQINASSPGLGMAVKTESEGVVNLPASLEQFEVKMPAEEKDIMAYYFLVAHPSRCLVFVNSIKTARRLDGLLRALGLNCRAVHSQLQQRQRLRALDSFRSSPVGVLVATDIAARGLDIAKVQYVLHYDVARSVQVYVHRSGRTARAGSKGTTISLVSPQDESHHADICRALSVPTLPSYKVDLSVLPELRSHVNLAKKIFTKSFALSQKQKANNWLKDTIRGSGLEADDDLFDGVDDGPARRGDDVEWGAGTEGERKGKRAKNGQEEDDDGSGISALKLAQFKREFAELEKSRREMKALIDRSIANGMYRSGGLVPTQGYSSYSSSSSGGGGGAARRKGAFIVVAR